MKHPSSIVGSDAQVDVDSSIGAFAVLGVDGGGSPLAMGPGAVVRSHAVVYRDVHIGSHFHAGHNALVRQGCRIGDSVSIGSNSVVEHDVKIGHRVRLHSGCFVPEETVLEDDAWLGPGVVITNSRYPNQADSKSNLEGVTVQERAVVGAGAVLLPGIVVGADSVVGAGAVVADSVDAGSVVIGNPAVAIS